MAQEPPKAIYLIYHNSLEMIEPRCRTRPVFKKVSREKDPASPALWSNQEVVLCLSPSLRVNPEHTFLGTVLLDAPSTVAQTQ